MPQPDAGAGLTRPPVLGRRAIATGVGVCGAVPLLAPSLFWPPALGLAVPAGTMLVSTGSPCIAAEKRYVVLEPLVGVAAGDGSTLALDANPARQDAIFGTVAAVAIHWGLFGAPLSRPGGRVR